MEMAVRSVPPTMYMYRNPHIGDCECVHVWGKQCFKAGSSNKGFFEDWRAFLATGVECSLIPEGWEEDFEDDSDDEEDDEEEEEEEVDDE